jgi:hypothetical protein
VEKVARRYRVNEGFAFSVGGHALLRSYLPLQDCLAGTP